MFLIDQYRLIGWTLILCWIGLAFVLELKTINPWDSLKALLQTRHLAVIALFCMFIGIYLTAQGTV